jgi:hypothetical protein
MTANVGKTTAFHEREQSDVNLTFKIGGEGGAAPFIRVRRRVTQMGIHVRGGAVRHRTRLDRVGVAVNETLFK